MKYVIDSGVAVKLLIPEIDSDKAIRLFDEFRKGIHQLISPDLIPTEVCNALMMAERRVRIPAGMADPLFQEVLKVCPDLRQAIPLLPRALQLGQQFQKSVYDCLFVSLAEREGCELVSADDRLVNTMNPTMPFVIALASLP